MNGPERLRIHVAPSASPTATTLVLLPAAATHADDFEREGFLAELKAHQLDLTIVRAEVPVDIYAADRLVELLHAEVLHPSRTARRSCLWMVGISLGGMTALACAEAHRDLVDGVYAMAPWPGPRPLWSGIPAAGGLAVWAAAHSDATFDDERRVWRWLGQGAPGGPEIFIGRGSGDRFGEGQQLMSDALPPDRRLDVDGGHDWPTWRALWRRFLGQYAPRWRADAPAPAPGPGS